MILFKRIFKSHIPSFVFSFVTLMFVFLLQFLMRYIDQLIGKGLSPFVIVELVSLNLAWMIVLAIPMSMLISVLMTYGGFSSTNEITAMKSSGVNYFQLFLPSLFLGIILTFFLVYFNNEILPETNHKAKSLIIDIRKKKPTFTIESGVFSNEIPGYSILSEKTYENSNKLDNIKIFNFTNPEFEVLIFAKKGSINFTKNFDKIIFDLENGEIHQLEKNNNKTYRKIKFEKHRIMTEIQGFSFVRSKDGTFEKSDRELSSKEMQKKVDSLKTIISNLKTNLSQKTKLHFQNIFENKNSNDSKFEYNYFSNSIKNNLSQIKYYEKEINTYLVEIHKKYAIPFACIIFVFIGAPLGIIVRRGNFGMSASLSLLFFLIYWSSLVGGEKLADRDLLPPFFAMWGANILLGFFGIILFYKVSKK